VFDALHARRLADGSLCALQAGFAGDEKAITATIADPGGAAEQYIARDLLLGQHVPRLLPGSAGQIFNVAVTANGRKAAFAVGWWTADGKAHNGILIARTRPAAGLRWVPDVFAEYPGVLRELEFAADGTHVLASTFDAVRCRATGSTSVLTVFSDDGKVLLDGPAFLEGTPEVVVAGWRQSTLRRIESGRFAWIEPARRTITVFALENESGSLRLTKQREYSLGNVLADSGDRVAFCAVPGAGDDGFVIAVRRKEADRSVTTRVIRVDASGKPRDSYTTRNPWRGLGLKDGRVESVRLAPSGTVATYLEFDYP
jgi:hypothetical protein